MASRADYEEYKSKEIYDFGERFPQIRSKSPATREGVKGMNHDQLQEFPKMKKPLRP